MGIKEFFKKPPVEKTKLEYLGESSGENRGEEQISEQTKAERKAELKEYKEQLKEEIKRYKDEGLERKEAKKKAEERLEEEKKDPKKMERVKYFEDLIQRKTKENRRARIQQEVRKSANGIKDVFLENAKENGRTVNKRSASILYKSPEGRIISVFIDEPLEEDRSNLRLNEYKKSEEEKEEKIDQLSDFIIGVDLHSSERGTEIKGGNQYKYRALKGEQFVLTDKGSNAENLARALELSEYTRNNFADFEELDSRGLE